MRARGADFSSAQTVEHVVASAASIEFAFVKLTQGLDYVSPVAHAQAMALDWRGKLVGLYHFLDTTDGARQWDHFERALVTFPPRMRVVACDYEMAGVSDAIARAFIARGRQRGYRVGLYGSSGVARKRLGQCWTWAAWWSSTPPPFRWDVWQFSDGNGAQDWNVFAGDSRQLAAWWARNKYVSAFKVNRPPLRWWIHDAETSTAIGPLGLATVGPRLVAYLARHPRSGRIVLERK